jgi:hypothetical protein
MTEGWRVVIGNYLYAGVFTLLDEALVYAKRAVTDNPNQLVCIYFLPAEVSEPVLVWADSERALVQLKLES